LPLGILKEESFSDQIQTFTVEEEDKIYLYSDGITEARNFDDELFGNQRLMDLLLKHKENRFEKVLEEFKLFVGQSAQCDDITIVELTCRKIPKEAVDI